METTTEVYSIWHHVRQRNKRSPRREGRSQGRKQLR
jgi:hypothetical protein